MHLDEARKQTLQTTHGNPTNFVRDVSHLPTVQSLLTVPKSEHVEAVMNTLKTLRLLTDDKRYADRVLKNYPELFQQIK